MPATRQTGNATEPDRWQQVAVLMVALGQDLAADLLRQFDDDEVAHITRAVAELKRVPRDVQDQVLGQFEAELKAGRLPMLGGAGFARALLERALGPDRARALWARMGSARAPVFRALDEADPGQVAPYIRREHPQAIALILSQLRPAQAAALLEQLPAATQSDVAHRIATLERVSPEVLEQVEAGLADTLERVLSGQQQVEGTRVAADILGRVGERLEKSLMERLDARDPQVAEDIRNRLFSFGDLARLSDRDARILLENADPDQLLVALKTAGKGVLDRVLSVVSERRRGQLLQDLAALPKMRLSQVEEAQLGVVQLLRRLEEQGLVDLSRSRQDDAWV